ncbi:MAG TPA: regulatory protein RecX [Candidatus Limnocylindrales bacterium]|nr:regulatory protein RecX [Candidatus Limnocylindrales bacterium]
MDEFEKYLNQSLRFLSYRPRTEKEIRDKLATKNAPQEVIENIVIKLKEHKFLNDEDFAKRFIEQRLRFKPKSLRIIKLELKQKGISHEIIEQAVVNLQNGNDSEATNSDLESAKKIVEQKMPRYQGLPKQEIYNKLGSFLARRGFNWDIIKKSIDDSLEDRL